MLSLSRTKACPGTVGTLHVFQEQTLPRIVMYIQFRLFWVILLLVLMVTE